MTPTTEFSVAEKEGLGYLRKEIEWHRTAGRYLCAIVAGALTTTTALARGALSDNVISNLELVPISFGIAVAFSAGISFYFYYRRIATLKSVTQALIRPRIADEAFKEKWNLAFLP